MKKYTNLEMNLIVVTDNIVTSAINMKKSGDLTDGITIDLQSVL